MSESTKTDWNRIKSLDNRDIDYSDIPRTDMKFWENSEIYMPQKKVELSIRIDEDLANWLKSQDKDFNMALNNLLRAFYLVNTQ
ncbi:3-oxoacyl-ACP synthase [Bacteroidota bacterium]